MWASMLTDFLAKVTGKANLKFDDVRQFPHPRDHFLVLRALRLNCLTADYAALWEELFDPTWRQDAWTREIPSLPIGEVTQEWAMATPLRRDAETSPGAEGGAQGRRAPRRARRPRPQRDTSELTRERATPARRGRGGRGTDPRR